MSENYTVCYSPKALDDLKDVYSYIAFTLQAPDTAKKQVNRIRKSIRSLDALPLRYPVVGWEPWQGMNIRKMPVDNFVVFYRVNHDDNSVTIIRIVYGSRCIENIVSLES
ncbi:MAG: type II toxin-antitoxin system RelE/ParE family toxin [Acutalibacteraceae bacterium]